MAIKDDDVAFVCNPPDWLLRKKKIQMMYGFPTRSSFKESLLAEKEDTSLPKSVPYCLGMFVFPHINLESNHTRNSLYKG